MDDQSRRNCAEGLPSIIGKESFEQPKIGGECIHMAEILELRSNLWGNAVILLRNTCRLLCQKTHPTIRLHDWIYANERNLKFQL